MMTVSTVPRISRAFDVSSRNSDSGVVIRMSGGLRTWRERSDEGVSPDRTATDTFAGSCPSRAATRLMPVSGARRLFSTSTARALSGEM